LKGKTNATHHNTFMGMVAIPVRQRRYFNRIAYPGAASGDE
jgi:hypothetical protein